MSQKGIERREHLISEILSIDVRSKSETNLKLKVINIIRRIYPD